MKSTTNATWLLGAAMALAVAVAGQAKAQSAPPDIVVTEKDNGKDVTLHADQRLIVRLPGSVGGFGWSALMTPDALLAFTDKPATAPAEKPPSGQFMMVGGAHDEIFAFRAARYTESSSEWFQLILCRAPCDLRNKAAKIFKIGVTTKKT